MWKRLLVLGVAVVGLALAGRDVSAQDVYVVYSGKDRNFKTEVVRSFAKDIDVKEYNADLLALADYSGKQKVVTKISRAEVVVIIGDKPMKNLKGLKVKANVIVVTSTSTDVKSTEELKYVVDHNTSLKGLPKDHLDVKTKDDLKDEDELEDADVLIVHKPAMELTEAIVALAGLFVG